MKTTVFIVRNKWQQVGESPMISGQKPVSRWPAYELATMILLGIISSKVLSLCVIHVYNVRADLLTACFVLAISIP